MILGIVLGVILLFCVCNLLVTQDYLDYFEEKAADEKVIYYRNRRNKFLKQLALILIGCAIYTIALCLA